MTEAYTPQALLDQPEMTPYQLRLTERYLLIAEMRAEGFSGVRPITLREIQIYLDFYPVDDVHEFVDHILSIDREVLSNVGKQADRHDRRQPG